MRGSLREYLTCMGEIHYYPKKLAEEQAIAEVALGIRVLLYLTACE